MAIRGQHFSIDQFDEDNNGGADFTDDAPVSAFNFLADVQERKTSAPQPPQPPSLRNTQGAGFPTHQKRRVPSKFKQNRQQDGGEARQSQNLRPPPVPTASTQDEDGNDDDDFNRSEKRGIDEENRMKIASMSEEEIEEERRELFKQLDPSLIERLLRRANIEEEGGPSNADFPGLAQEPPQPKPSKPRKSVKFADSAHPTDSLKPADAVSGHIASKDQEDDPSANPGVSTNLGEEEAAKLALPTDSSVHFPQPPQPPSLDPSSATFLTDLHEKYFPSLPADPSKLEWMTSTPSDATAYSTTQSSLDPKDIRFSFTGTLIPPSLASEIPVTAGLHHHGNAPDAAGYTIPELSMLARSTVAAQRCVALQTLGRILYRLGRGEFGDPGEDGAGTVGAEDTMGELARGLWEEVDKEGVIEICVSESEGRGVAGGRHVSARSYATEAVWLWQKGGGRRWKAA